MSKWTKTIYILLFLFLLLQPHIIQGHIFYFSSPYLQSLATLFVFLVAYEVYILHKRDIIKREQEKTSLQEKVIKLNEEVEGNYRYIGALNMRVPLLQEITTGLLQKRKATKKEKKEIFDELLLLATASIGKGKWGEFRFVENSTFHTTKEFRCILNKKEKNPQKIGNKELVNYLQQDQFHILKEGYIVGSSETDSSVQCVYILSSSQPLEKDQIMLLRAIVDQAQLLYSHLYLKNKFIPKF